LVALAALVLGTAFVSRSGVEDALGTAASKHLDAVGMKGVALEVDGLNVTAKVPFGRDVHDVENEVATVPGVGLVTSRQVYRSKAEKKACTNLQRDLDRVTDKRRIPFVGTTAQPTTAGLAMLKRSAALLEACPGATIIVGGHSDTHTNNYSTLSLERARVMVAALKRAGVAVSRLTPRGYGDEFPVAEGDSPAAQQRNQRGSLTVQGG
jgi:outer membrane protein OmpA-like peptidoglycan-associated protein